MQVRHFSKNARGIGLWMIWITELIDKVKQISWTEHWSDKVYVNDCQWCENMDTGELWSVNKSEDLSEFYRLCKTLMKTG